MPVSHLDIKAKGMVCWLNTETMPSGPIISSHKLPHPRATCGGALEHRICVESKVTPLYLLWYARLWFLWLWQCLADAIFSESL